jgi:hypothetical protein
MNFWIWSENVSRNTAKDPNTFDERRNRVIGENNPVKQLIGCKSSRSLALRP